LNVIKRRKRELLVFCKKRALCVFLYFTDSGGKHGNVACAEVKKIPKKLLCSMPREFSQERSFWARCKTGFLTMFFATGLANQRMHHNLLFANKGGSLQWRPAFWRM
jgi:hypothetical protein